MSETCHTRLECHFSTVSLCCNSSAGPLKSFVMYRTCYLSVELFLCATQHDDYQKLASIPVTWNKHYQFRVSATQYVNKFSAHMFQIKRLLKHTVYHLICIILTVLTYIFQMHTCSLWYSFTSVNCSRTESSTLSATGFYRPDTFLSSNQHCQSIQGRTMLHFYHTTLCHHSICNGTVFVCWSICPCVHLSQD